MALAHTPPWPISDHFDGERFFNPGVNTDRGFSDILRWRREGHRVPWPSAVANPPAPPLASVPPGSVAFTAIGHATYLIRTASLAILTDPIFSERASPFSFAGPKRVRPPGVSLAALPPIDVILLSHNHYDHMDLPSLRALEARSHPTIVTGLGNAAALKRNGIRSVVELDWWQSAPVSPALDCTFVPAQHWSSRTLLDRRRTLWGGFVVALPEARIYFAGDTGFFPGFADIRARCGAPDVALLPIGAYEPRWFMRAQHMDPAEAVAAHGVLEAKRSLATHWGTFQLTDEGIEAPLEELERAKAASGLPAEAFTAPLPGETVVWHPGDRTAVSAELSV